MIVFNFLNQPWLYVSRERIVGLVTVFPQAYRILPVIFCGPLTWEEFHLGSFTMQCYSPCSKIHALPSMNFVTWL